MSKLNVKEVIRSHGMTIRQVACEYYGKPATCEREIKIMAVQFANCFIREAGNPTVKSLQRIAEIVGVDITDLFDHKDEGEIIFTSPETGKRYRMIPID